jgi:type I restriction enzyme S subunit
MEIPLPPIEEQRRIVARIEELAARIEEARGLRREVVEETEEIIFTKLGELIGNPYNNTLGTIAVDQFTRIENISIDVSDGPHVTPNYVNDGIPFITVLNITSGRLDFASTKFITPEDHSQFQRRAKAERGDVLISKDGSIGIPCYIDTDREFSYFVSVALIKPRHDLIEGRFLTWMLRTPYIQERIKIRSRGDMIRHLVLREIRDIVIPVLPLIEQHNIVAYLDNLQSKIDPLKQLQSEISAELDALLPSILDKAFKGEL